MFLPMPPLKGMQCCGYVMRVRGLRSRNDKTKHRHVAVSQAACQRGVRRGCVGVQNAGGCTAP